MKIGILVEGKAIALIKADAALCHFGFGQLDLEHKATGKQFAELMQQRGAAIEEYMKKLKDLLRNNVNITPRYGVFCGAVVLFTVLLDFVTKRIVMGTMELYESIPLIRDVLHITYIHNDGAAFGSFSVRYFSTSAASSSGVSTP